MRKAAGILLSTISIAILASCDRTDPEKSRKDQKTDIVPSVAVFYNTAEREMLHRVADLAVSNFKAAMEKEGMVAEANLQWFNADSVNLDITMEKLGLDNSIYAIIAPQHSRQCRNILYIGHKLATKLDICKPILLPAASSVELQRQFSNLNFVWFLSESNMSQGEMLLSVADSLKYPSIGIVSTDDTYGSDFANHIPFMAKEWGIPVNDVTIIPAESSDEDFSDAVRNFAAAAPESMIVVASSSPSNYSATAALGLDNIYFTDAATSKNISSTPGKISGISLSPAPDSGFLEYYRNLSGTDPTNGEAQFYDAIILALLSHYGAATLESSENNIISNFRSSPSNGISWTVDGLHGIINELKSGNSTSGLKLASVTFDSTQQTLSSTYLLWSKKEGKIFFERYLDTRKYSRRSQKNGSIYDWYPSSLDVDIDADLRDGKEYVDGGANWALVVASSEGWSNYRHQSDALNIYRILRKSGYDEDHIVLIVNDDIAWDPKNIFPGNIFHNIVNGENLYENIRIDHKTGDISPALLKDLISPAPEDNIFVFWSGHGTVDGSLCWLDRSNGRYCTVSPDEVDAWVQDMEEKGFNKMMMVIEACYSGKIAKTVNRPGVLIITAAGELESSFAANTYSEALGTYIADEFSLLFSNEIESNRSITIHDLYRNLYLGVKMSHVTISDFSRYGSLYKYTMKDYL